MPTTEIVAFQLRDGIHYSDLEKPDSKLSVVFRDWSREITKRKGFRGFNLGVSTERPDLIVVTLVWDSIQHHAAVLRSPAYQPICERIMTVLHEPTYMYHVDFTPHSRFLASLAAPVTAFSFFHFGPDGPPSDFLERARGFSASGQQEAGSKPMSGAFGITHEEVEEGDSCGRVAVFIAGWESLEAHEGFKKSETYRKWTPKLVDGVRKVEISHVEYQVVVTPGAEKL